MRTKTTKAKKNQKSAARDRNGGSVCDLCAHENDDNRTPCSATCVNNGRLDNPLLESNGVAYERRSPHLTAFYCACAQLHSDLHRATQLSAAERFHEAHVCQLGNDVLARLRELLANGVASSDDNGDAAASSPRCPFVMLLSIVLPSLRKYLDYVRATRTVWAFAGASSSASTVSVSTLSASSTHLLTPSSWSASTSERSSVSDTTLLTMITLHDTLMRVLRKCEQLAHLIERNAAAADDDESTMRARIKPTVNNSGSGSRPRAMRIPQVTTISREFDDVVAEYKCELAELTESILETTETTASRMCRPLMAKDAAKSRGTVTEYMELLVLQLLSPIRQRAVASPSVSRTYLMPRIIERCISVTMEEFVLNNVKMNEILAAQFEKSMTCLRAWCLAFETEYNGVCVKQKRSTIAFGSSESQLEIERFNNTGDDGSHSSSSSSSISNRNLRGDADAHENTEIAFERLQLVGLDGFKRLDNVLNAWLRSSSKTAEDETLSARSRVKVNLGGLRTTIARSITTRSR